MAQSLKSFVLWFVSLLYKLYSALQRQNTEISKQRFPEKEYRGLSPNFHIHASVSDLYIPTIGQTHECWNWGWGRAIPRKGIHKCDFRCSVLYLSSYSLVSFLHDASVHPQGADPPALLKARWRQVEIIWTSKIPPPPTGISKRYSQSKSNLSQAALLRRCELLL
jgi:hypothetical protein